MSFREKTNKEVLVFQSTGLGMIIAEPSFWKALILQHLVNLCLSGEKDMPFLSLCICCAAVQNTPYTFLLLALPTLSWRLSFSLCLDCHVWVSPHLCKISSFSMFPQPPSAKFIFFLMVHNFPFFLYGKQLFWLWFCSHKSSDIFLSHRFTFMPNAKLWLLITWNI